MTLSRATLAFFVGLSLCRPVSAGADRFHSAEFCFSAQFPSPPQTSDDDRTVQTAGGPVPLRARNFFVTDADGALIVTVVKFDSKLVTDAGVPAYLDSVVQSHTKTVGGRLLSVASITDNGRPARAFDIEWLQNGVVWRSRYVSSFFSGHTLSHGVIYRASQGLSARGRAFLTLVRADAACLPAGA